MATDQLQIAVRVPPEWVPKLDALAEAMSRPGIPLTRTDAIRACIAQGLSQLEAEYADKKPKPKR